MNTHDEILAALQGERKPLLIKEIAEKVGYNRQKVARNLDALEILGRVRKIEIGNAKKYYLVKSIPVSSLIDLSIDLILIIDSEYHIQYLNHSAQKFLGIHEKPVVGERLDLLNLDIFSTKKVLNGLKNFSPEKVFRIEIDYIREEKIQWYSLSIMAISLKPNSYSIALVAEDVTKKKLIETALIESENKFRSIFTAEADSIFLFDQGNGTILEANQAACNTYGYPYDEILRLKFSDLSAHEELQAGSHIIPQNSHPFMYHKKRDNSVFPVDIRTSSFSIEEHQLTIAAIRDVTERKRMEDELRESEEFSTSIFNSVTYEICILDEKGTIISINQRWKDFAKENHLKDEAHYTGWNYLSVCDNATGPGSEDARNFADGIRAVIRGDLAVYCQEYGCHTPENKQYYVGRVNRLNFSGAGPLRILITHEDITLRKISEIAHLESENRLREVLEYSSDVPYRIDSLTGKYEYLSPSVQKIVGYSAEEFTSIPSESLLRLIHPDDWDSFKNAQEKIKNRKPGNFEIEFRFKHKNGHYVWLEDVLSIICESDNRSFWVGRVRDISDRKKVQDELKNAQDNASFLSGLLEISSLPFAISYPDGKFGYCNKAFLELTGYSREEIQEVHAFEKINIPYWKERYTQFRNDLEDHGSPIRIEKEYVRKDGSRVPVEINLHVKYLTGGDVDFFYGFITDITERKKAEQKNIENQNSLEEIIRDRTAHLEKEIESRIETEKNLQASETRFRSLFDLSPSAIVVYDADIDRIIDANPAAERLYACSRTYLLTVDPQQVLLHKPSSEFIRHSFNGNKRRVLNGEEVIVERTIVDQNGEQKYCIIQLVRIPHEGRNLIRASFIDITKRRTLEEALERSNNYNRSLIEANMDPLVTIGPDGRITDVNVATELVTGYSRHTLIGSEFWNFFSDRAKASEGFLQVLQHSKIRNYPLEIKHRDGHITPVLYNASVYRDEEGEIAGVLAAARDVTEQIRMNKIYKDSEDRFFTFFENSPIGMAIVSPDGRCLKVNQALCTILGYSPEELSITPFTTYTHPDDREADMKQYEAIQNGRINSYVMEKRFIHKNGQIIWVQLNVSSVKDKTGSLSYFISQAQDITRQKELEFKLY